MRQIKYLGLGLLMLLCGCSHTFRGRQTIYSNAQLSRDTVAAVGNASPNIATQAQLVASLKQHGIQVLSVGDNVSLILPVDSFFQPQSPQLIYENDSRLNHIADYIKRIPKVTVHIRVYSNASQQPARALALTRQQAHTIADYLWQQHIDARLVLANGFGMATPTASNATRRGRSLNRRIVINLRRLPACCVL